MFNLKLSWKTGLLALIVVIGLFLLVIKTSLPTETIILPHSGENIDVAMFTTSHGGGSKERQGFYYWLDKQVDVKELSNAHSGGGV